MAASAAAFPPYWLEPSHGDPPEQTVAAYLSISAHPLVQNFSFEELRLKYYNNHGEATRPYLSDTSKLMTTRQRAALRMTPPTRAIRAEADNTDKCVSSEDTCKRCS